MLRGGIDLPPIAFLAIFMKKVIYLFFCLLISPNALWAQNVPIDLILEDREMKEYVWAEGFGETLEQADNDALVTLVKHDAMISGESRSSLIDSTSTSGSYARIVYESNTHVAISMYLEGVCREVLTPLKKGQQRVLRYVKRTDWENRYNALKAKIEEYIQSGKYASLVEDRIRYYAWAHILLQNYPENKEPIMVEGKPAKTWLYTEIRSILSKIEISVIGIETDESNRNYPHKLYLDFVYKDTSSNDKSKHIVEPISYMRFAYFDGRGWVENESVKDGRGVIQLAQLEAHIEIRLDCLSKALARQIEPYVSMILENKHYSTTFEEGTKKVATKKPKNKVDTSLKGVDSQVNRLLDKGEESYVEINDKVESVQPYLKIMNEVAASISHISTQDISYHFTKEAWEQYQNIVANGNPIIARTPEYKFIRHDTLTICQSLPLKLHFKGNHSFIEDVVFRVNNKTYKVESVAYRLSAKTERTIMSMAWDDKARLTLMSFLEDYRSAYCLRNIDYIAKVFAEDAYIIVGRVLKQSNRQFTDTPDSINGSTTIYTKKNKQQYVSDLQKSFASKEFVNLRFEECNIAKGYDAKEGIYAVQVRQLYYSNNYADNGILTLAIDMRDEANPLVRVRVWQNVRDVKYNAEQMIERTVSVDNGLN